MTRLGVQIARRLGLYLQSVVLVALYDGVTTRGVKMRKVGVAAALLGVFVLSGLVFVAGRAAAADPACPTSWPQETYEDFFTDSEGAEWFVIRSVDSQGYEMVRAYPASDLYNLGYVPNSPDETCYLLVRRPGDAEDSTGPSQVTFRKEAEEPSPESPTTPPDLLSRLLAGDSQALDRNTRWGDLFITLTGPEQACIRSGLNEEQLASAMAGQIYREGDTEEWEVVIFGCLDRETAAAVFYFIFATRLGLEGVVDDETASCIRDLLVAVDIPALVAGSLPDTQGEEIGAVLQFWFGLVACFTQAGGLSPEVLSEQDETRLWSFATDGWVSAAPAVVDGVVYVGSDDHQVYALDAATGTELWRFATDDAVKSVPAVSDGVVYVGSNDHRLYALDAGTGGKLWSHDTGAWVQSSPTIKDGVVYSSALVDGEPRVVALDASSGEPSWTAQQPHAFDPEFAPIVVGGKVYLPGAEYGVFHALDAADGGIAWSASVGSYVETGPTVLGGVVYLTVVNEAYALDESTGDEIWSYGTERYPARDFPALVVDGVYYLSPDEVLHALRADTGETLWTYQASTFISAAPVVAHGMVFAAAEDGEMFALDADTGAELWITTAEGRGPQSLTVSEGVLYLESDLGNLMAIDASDGQPIRDYQKGYFLGLTNYTVQDGVVYFGSFPNEVHAYTAPEPQ